MKRLTFVPAVLVLGLAAAAPAHAQTAGRAEWTYADEARQPYIESRRAAYDNGYREGLKEGERDARRRDAFNYQDERTWQRGDKGYHRTYGDRDRYAQSFRTGYAAGYSDAYRRVAPGYNDGYEKGREDARDRDSDDVLRHKWYREGDHDYKSSFGPRQQYENVYRQAFREGYDRGYREWSYGR